MIGWLRWKIAWIRWMLEMPYKPGDPSLGPEGPVRRHNIRLIALKHLAREPMRRDYP